MKKIKFILSVIIFIFFAAFVMAQEEDKKDIPAGMEKRQIGGSEFLVPKDTKVSKKGDLVILEPAHEYVARKFEEMEERLIRIEAKEQEFDVEIGQIKETLAELQKHASESDAQKQ